MSHETIVAALAESAAVTRIQAMQSMGNYFATGAGVEIETSPA